MLNKLRNFTKTKLATVLIGIIIIPFVLFGLFSWIIQDDLVYRYLLIFALIAIPFFIFQKHFPNVHFLKPLRLLNFAIAYLLNTFLS